MKKSKPQSKRSKKKWITSPSNKRTEEDNISHAIHGFKPFSMDMKSTHEQKGVEIRAQSGVRDINPPIEKGTVIKNARHG